MIGRLGNVLYWVGSAISALIIIGGIVLVLNRTLNLVDFIFLALAAVVVWITGRGCRYILCGN